jgi:nicotinate-nucleotide pyrophosphorylase (carboxylating)
MIDLLELYFHEDCPYEDESVELLGIRGKGTLRIVSREAGVCACAEELAEHYRTKGIKMLDYLKDGEKFESGENILEAKGDLKLLFRFWRVSQTFLSLMCAIAGKTASLVIAGKKENPDILLQQPEKHILELDFLSSKLFLQEGEISTGTLLVIPFKSARII